MTTINDFNPDFKTHKRAKRIKLRYDAINDRAVITMPRFTSKLSALKFATSNIEWLKEQRTKTPKPIYLIDGSIIPILGEMKKVIHDPILAARVNIDDQRIIVGGPKDGFSVRLENHLKKEALKTIEPMAQEMAMAINKKYKRIQIRDTKSRWGSCSSSGNLSFSWRLIMTPPQVLEYVVAHEISHLAEMNHSQRFWDIVDTLVSHAKPSRKWLKNEGQSLMMVLNQ